MHDATPLDHARPLPGIRALTFADLATALRAGAADFKATPRFGAAFGALYAIGGLLILFIVNGLGYAFLAPLLMAGFTLIGPFAAIGLYEISRLRERGDPVSWAAISAGMRAQPMREVGYLGLILFFILAVWLKSGAVLYALFFGLRMLSLNVILEAIMTTPAGLAFIVTGHILGLGFALAAFSISVVSFPLIADRHTDFITALITSIRVVGANPKIMLSWGALIALLLALATLPGFLGLIVILPVLGHSSWHLYRRAIA